MTQILPWPCRAALLGLVWVGTATAEPATDANRFLWNQANARMATATAPAEFAEAASVYRQMLDRGLRNGDLFRNYGTAILLAESPDAAVDALLRAERYGGSSPDLRRNLELALAARAAAKAGGTGAAQTEGLSWTRTPLFWHYQLPLRLRLHIIVLLHATLWLALVLRVVRLRAAARGLAAASLVGLVLFGSSVLVSLHQNATPLPEPAYRWAAPEGPP